MCLFRRKISTSIALSQQPIRGDLASLHLHNLTELQAPAHTLLSPTPALSLTLIFFQPSPLEKCKEAKTGASSLYAVLSGSLLCKGAAHCAHQGLRWVSFTPLWHAEKLIPTFICCQGRGQRIPQQQSRMHCPPLPGNLKSGPEELLEGMKEAWSVLPGRTGAGSSCGSCVPWGCTIRLA